MILNNGLQFMYNAAITRMDTTYKTYDSFIAMDGSTCSAYIYHYATNTDGFLGWQQYRTSWYSNMSMVRFCGTFSAVCNGTTYFLGANTYTEDKCGVIFGDGETPPALTDYSLSGNQITDFTATTATTRAVVDEKIKVTITYNITNTGAASFTIKEMAASIRSTNGKQILLSRSLLETPVTIQPGETGVITYKMEIS